MVETMREMFYAKSHIQQNARKIQVAYSNVD